MMSEHFTNALTLRLLSMADSLQATRTISRLVQIGQEYSRLQFDPVSGPFEGRLGRVIDSLHELGVTNVDSSTILGAESLTGWLSLEAASGFHYVTPSHCKALAGVSDPDHRRLLLERADSEHWGVRRTLEEAKDFQAAERGAALPTVREIAAAFKSGKSQVKRCCEALCNRLNPVMASIGRLNETELRKVEGYLPAIEALLEQLQAEASECLSLLRSGAEVRHQMSA